ncbi:MAG: hypothetical protein ABID32_06145 [Candidatus Omnitrophota bacterium]
MTANEGHAGVFYGWPFAFGGDPSNRIIPLTPIEEANPQNLSQYATVEALGGSYPFVGKSNIASFLSRGATFWGVHTADLTYLQRNQIVNTAKNQLGCKYHFFWGYKSPGVSFRCDGLVEYCYEQAGVDLVPGDTWNPKTALLPWRHLLTPKNQMNSPLLSGRSFAELETLELDSILQNNEQVEPDSNGVYYVCDRPGRQDVVTIKVNADGGGDGSGVRMADFWVGKPDDTPDIFEGNDGGKRIEIDDHKEAVGGIYKADWIIDDFGLGEYTLYILAYDQAGNMGDVMVQVEIIEIAPISASVSGKQIKGEGGQSPFWFSSFNQAWDWVVERYGMVDWHDTGGTIINCAGGMMHRDAPPENPEWPEWRATLGAGRAYLTFNLAAYMTEEQFVALIESAQITIQCYNDAPIAVLGGRYIVTPPGITVGAEEGTISINIPKSSLQYPTTTILISADESVVTGLIPPNGGGGVWSSANGSWLELASAKMEFFY